MHRDTERFLTFLMVKQEERNKVILRKLRYGRPSKLLDKEEAKFDKYQAAMDKINIKEKRRRWHPLQQLKVKGHLCP